MYKKKMQAILCFFSRYLFLSKLDQRWLLFVLQQAEKKFWLFDLGVEIGDLKEMYLILINDWVVIYIC